MRTAAPASESQVQAGQPAASPRMSGYKSSARAADTSTTPPRSSLRPAGARDSGTSRHARVMATTPKGRLTRNTGRHASPNRSEEHTSELQSLAYLVCRLLLEKKKKKTTTKTHTQPIPQSVSYKQLTDVINTD